ncbi:MAG TPA: cation diffusion facilitator family transporter [Candidatus Acidoferrales bacterium]|nr:cation diffusion facilitator family transporter [Candidatus Acidoferrales bacterium]
MRNITKTTALKLSLFAMASVIIVEAFAGLSTRSLALVSDAAHATFDALSTLILLLTTRISMKPADEDHTYGHGKFESLGALIGGFILLLFAIGIAGLAIYRLSTGSHAESSLLGYGAAGYTMAIDIGRILILSAALRSGSLTVKADLYHAASDLFSTSLVFVALGLTSLGFPVGDTAVSLVLASLLGTLSVRLIRVSILDLSDAVSGKLVKSVLRVIRETNEVLKVKELRVRRVGDVTYVDAICAVSPYAGLADADGIASRIETNLHKLLGKSSVILHLEPLEWDVPVELRVRDVTNRVEGAKGLHNVSVTNVGEDLYVTLHVQVDPSLPLEKADEIATLVEKGIQSSIPKVRHVTVHLEPSLPETMKGKIIDDNYVSETVRSVVRNYPDVLNVSAVTTFAAEGKLHINVTCLFSGNAPISEIHDIISKVEESVRERFVNAIVTIHPEPAAGQRSFS